MNIVTVPVPEQSGDKKFNNRSDKKKLSNNANINSLTNEITQEYPTVHKNNKRNKVPIKGITKISKEKSTYQQNNAIRLEMGNENQISNQLEKKDVKSSSPKK